MTKSYNHWSHCVISKSEIKKSCSYKASRNRSPPNHTKWPSRYIFVSYLTNLLLAQHFLIFRIDIILDSSDILPYKLLNMKTLKCLRKILSNYFLNLGFFFLFKSSFFTKQSLRQKQECSWGFLLLLFFSDISSREQK